MELGECEAITRRMRRDKLPASRKVRKRRELPFVGWDGEGFTDKSGKHHYALFGNSEGQRIQGYNLKPEECLGLLFQAPKDAIHVIYAGTYDVTMIFRDSIHVHAVTHSQYVAIGRYRVRFLKGKSLHVKDLVTKESRVLYDVFTFFGTSFVKACREYLTPEECQELGLDRIQEMKEQRASFTKITPETVAYMELELRALVRLATVLRERLAQVGIYPSRWHGPGAIASTVLRDQRIREKMAPYDDDLREAAEAAYYGGRFEQFKRGTYIGPVYQYDIRSAYPYAMSLLPDLSNLRWQRERKSGGIVDRPYALYLVRTRHLPDGWTVPHRAKWGTIYFPEFAYGWYWGIELPPGIKYVEAWIPLGLDVEAFSFVEEMYNRRARLKSEGKPEQLALKLALNSLYGKLAQSKGANWNGKQWQKPTYHELLWAGYITAYTRSMLLQALRLAGDSAIAVETDAIFTTKPLDLELGTGLGKWDCTVYEGIKYIQSGVSMTLSNGVWSYKTRGITLKRTGADVELWNDLLRTGSVTISQTRFVTDTRFKGFGNWQKQDRTLVLDDPRTLQKRVRINPCEECGDYLSHLHPLYVPPVEFQLSTPYKFVWRKADDPGTYDPVTLIEYNPELEGEYQYE
jgi:hypothetical protein